MDIFNLLPRQLPPAQGVGQHLNRRRRLRGKVLIDDEIQPPLLQILPCMGCQVMTDHMHFARGLGALQRTHAAAHGFICHIDAAQPRILPQVLQNTIIGQFILLHAFNHVCIHVAAKNFIKPVQKAAHAQPMGGKLAVSGHHQHFCARYVRREQARSHPSGFDHVLSDMVQAATLPHIGVTGDDLNACRHQAVDLLAHGERIRRGQDQAVDSARLQPLNRFKIRAVRTVFQLLHQYIYVIQATVMHCHANAFSHTANKKRIPARQDYADAISAPSHPRCLPLRRCFIAILVYHFLHALAHLGRYVRASVYHPVHRAARDAALLRYPLCSYLHQLIPLYLCCCSG